MFLYNRLGKEQLLERLKREDFRRKTLSFYRYVEIENPQEFRDKLYVAFDDLKCLGRIYVAHEGINAQMNVPGPRVGEFLALLERIPELRQMPLKWALEQQQVSFLKLKIKVREKIVADGLNEKVFDTTNVGRHLSPLEFHELSAREDVLVVDMRNNYESEVGRFENAICPDADTFREEVEMVAEQLSDEKDKKILLYCTGGVRCEKASAWLRHHGFKDVNQLHGGIIAYAAEIKQMGLPSRFIGKNFVFDERLGERVTPDVIAKCHTCGTPCDNHDNCRWDPCHKLFIQCDACKESFAGCCSDSCTQSYLSQLQNSSSKNYHSSYAS
ncbi:MAG: rhodanese-related sulfurtransferase [Bacteroidetes bacterium]|nr:MAG: rhodanese-related sulfurtransferase [Bacteroidota bacterium]